MKEVMLEVLTAPGCQHCAAFEAWWQPESKNWPNVKHQEISILSPAGQVLASKYLIMASPGIVLNGELFATGGVNREKFLLKLKELSS
ncbi:MAG: thioredoxin family protein [Candidatus Vogelbacteria bacterium]|nr:thioredoxin family protein [Candidatus Vogelbacteria bacterium]